jgi:osmotically inducible protein OsmC
MMFGSGAFDGAYSFGSRFESGTGTNPEELLGAAHAGCFSMSLANMLAQAGHAPESVETEARVDLEKGDSGFSITRITLVTEASVRGISEEEFQRHARAAKEGCPVSRALAATEIALEARLRA